MWFKYIHKHLSTISKGHIMTLTPVKLHSLGLCIQYEHNIHPSPDSQSQSKVYICIILMCLSL